METRRILACADGVHGDRDLMVAALSDDKDAFGELAERHWRAAYEIAQSIVRNAQDASELVQESLLRAWRALDRFLPGKPFAPWFYRIVRNTSIQFYRSRRRHPLVSLNLESADEHPVLQLPDAGAAQPEDALVREERARQLEGALGRLPDSERTLLHLAHHEGLSYQEIAGELAVPVTTVRGQLRQSRARMRSLLAAAPDAL